MKNLSTNNILNLSPAETLMILDPINSSGKAMIRTTFLELVLLKIIKIDKKIESTNNPAIPKAQHFYATKGINFNTFKPKPHQSIILDPLHQKEKVNLKYLISYVLVNSGQNFHDFKINFIYRPLVKLGYFKKSFLYRFLFFQLTEKGSTYRDISKDKINIGNKHFENWLINEKEKANTYFSEVGANIFLLEELKFELLTKINFELESFQKGLNSNDSDLFPYFDPYWASQIGEAIHETLEGNWDSLINLDDYKI